MNICTTEVLFHFQSELLGGVVGSLFTDEEQKHGWLMTL